MDRDVYREPLKVLYEDNHLIAVHKPCSLLVQGDSTGAPTLFKATKNWLKNKYQKKGNVFLGIVHRLDKPVSGVVLFAKTTKGASRIGEQMRHHQITKKYEAWVQGAPKPSEAVLIHYLEIGEKKITAYDEPGPGRKLAKLSYRTLEKISGFSRLEVQLFTGRKHQIRIQLALIGHPIVGDTKHGSFIGTFDGSIKLLSREIEFSHPVRGDRVRIVSPGVFYLTL